MGIFARSSSVVLATAMSMAISAGGAGAATAPTVERLPAADFRPCTTAEQVFCVESVVFEPDGLPAIAGVWVPSGQAIPLPDSDDSTTPAVVPSLQPTSPSVSYPGRWSFPGFPVDSVGYDGLYVQVGPASTASDFAWIRLNPASARVDGSVGRAVASEGSTTPRDLDPAMKTTVVMRFGPLEPTANVMVADGLIASEAVSEDHRVKFSGYPVLVPRAASSADCQGESGVAMDVVRQQYAFVVFGNTRQSFGYDGMTGDLSISTNGTCYISTPTYDSTSSAFTFTASAPHFAPDGSSFVRGFYVASIPLQDAELLFGITSPKQVKAALELSVENEQGVDVPVQYSVAVRRGVITISAMNFRFSRPTFTLKVKEKLWKAKYKKAAKKAQMKAAS